MVDYGALRVIAGKYKQRKLASPQSRFTHPMGAREKLALFNMLQPWVNDAKILDVYAGTGALGIEALSRGAQSAVFVEANRKVAEILRENLRFVQEPTKIYTEKAEAFTRRLEMSAQFDVILADPPYDAIEDTELAELAKDLAPRGVFALSYPVGRATPELPDLEKFAERQYAGAKIVLYRAN